VSGVLCDDSAPDHRPGRSPQCAPSGAMLDRTTEGGRAHMVPCRCLAVNSPYYSYYFRATLMAPMCLVRVIERCYCADRVQCWFLPCGQVGLIPNVGGEYAIDASVLRGNWLCGGPLDFSAASGAGRRSRHTLSIAGTSVERLFRAWARTPLRLHFVTARP
jgi:hypothetical protein